MPFPQIMHHINHIYPRSPVLFLLAALYTERTVLLFISFTR